jgi:hypothetical protein
VPADCGEARPPVAQRALHQWADGTPGAFRRRSLGRDCDHFVLHIYASLAEQERKLISARNKAAAAARKLRGQLFGLQMLPKAEQRRISALGRAAKSKAAMERAEAYRVHLEWALNHPGRFGRPITFRRAAERLNERQLPSPMGSRWCSMYVCAMALTVQPAR